MKCRILEVFALCFALAIKANAQTPIITSQPQSVTNNNASAAQFTVVATNAATYQWYFQGTNLLQGETNALLSLDDLGTNQAGSYTVVVTSSNNISVTSSPPAVLTIVPGTIIQWTISTYPNGSSSNFLVQLFDHDKPATVENFLHYVYSGAYSNTFFDRDVTGFVLQGGDYISGDRATNGLNVNTLTPGTNFPTQVNNEFSLGPLIHNTFGTLVMAKLSGEPDSATSAFFFNLADNSTNLDNQNGGFTVFGRILYGTNAGSNVLQYFNTLSGPNQGIYTGFENAPTLPVNYDGTTGPSDAQLFYCDFTFISPTNAPILTNTPMVAVTYPAPNAVFTNGGDLTVTGTASVTNGGLAEVFCILTPLTGPSTNTIQTNVAIGTTNWTLDLGTNQPGIYQLTAYAEDGAGNLSAPATQYFTNLAIVTIITNTDGQLTTNTLYLVPGQQYSETNEPGAGELFVTWQNQGAASINPVETFTPETNSTLTVTLISNTLPAGLAITNPVAGSINHVTNDALILGGTLPASITVTQVTVQLFIESNAVSAALPAVINGANWSLTVSNLVTSEYTVLVVAEDSLGEEGLATESFSTLVPPIIISQPTNVSALVGSAATFSITATNVVNYQWELVGGAAIAGATNSSYVLADVSTNMSGISYEVVLTSPDGETLTSAPEVLTVVTGTFVQITLAGFPNGFTSNVVVQLYDQEKPATVANFLHYITPDNYAGFENYVPFTNMVWDRCIPGFILQGGSYDAADQTNGTPPQNLASTLYSINNEYTSDSFFSPTFDGQVANEFNVGPVLHNTYGTLAMALVPGNSNSATSSFFFNLADNSAKLDQQAFTVFGRIVSGSNVLQYFNTLSKPNHGIFDSTAVSTNQTLPNLPVNYQGWGLPANSNLFFADFKLLSTFDTDTNPPTAVLVFPTNGQTLTNVTLVVQGTASDNVAVANVSCTCEGSNFSRSVYASGTTNWTAQFGTLAPGLYTNLVVAQDGAGNTSTKASNTFVVPLFPFQSTVIGPGTVSPNLTGSNTTVGANYTMTATPGKGAVFVNWTSVSNAALNPTQSFTMVNGLQLTANFIYKTNLVTGGITAITPKYYAQLTNETFSITGKVAASFGPAQITCQVFSASTSNSVSPPMVINATNTWATPAVSLPAGQYVLQVVAQNARGKVDVVSNPFIILTPLTVIINGHGSTSIANNTYLEVGARYQLAAEPGAGEKFLSWNLGGGAFPYQSFSFYMTEGSSFEVTFVSNSVPGKLTITAPAANGSVATTNITLAGKITSMTAPQVVCQLFDSATPVTDFMQASVSGTTWNVLATNLSMGSYTAVAIATDASGKTTFASEQFSLNLYPNIAGTYHGVFFDPNLLAETNAGYVSFVLSKTGVVDGSVAFPVKAYPINFSMGYSSTITGQLSPAVNPALSLTMNFDTTNFSGLMTGFVTQGNEACPLTAYRVVTKLSTNTVPAPGHYVLSLSPETNASGPAGNGFAGVTVLANGSLAAAGTLADNTSFSQSPGVFTNGVWPLYANLFSGHGMLIGWETNLPSGAIAGSLYWLKSPGYGTYYAKSNLNEQLTSVGTNYIQPTPGAQYQIVFGGGTLTSLVTNVFSFNAAGTMVPIGKANNLKGKVLTTGVVNGSMVNPVDNKTLNFDGIIFSPAEGGSGFTLDTGSQTGYFDITPVSQ